MQSLMSGRNIWINFNQVRHIIPWKKMQEFDAIFEIFGRDVFEAIEVKERSRLNFEVIISKLINQLNDKGLSGQNLHRGHG